MNDSPPTCLLIVCTANAIRSPFIEHLLRARLVDSGVGDAVIGSAGTAARPGSPAERDVVEIGRTYGLDLDRHRTRRLEEAMLSHGTIVLCAAAHHRRTVLDMRPDLLDTTFTVREFARLLGEEERAAGGDWTALVRAAGQRRTRRRPVPGRSDDLLDPIGQSADVWANFEKDAVSAVEAIAAHAQRLLRPDAEAARRGATPLTRREWRASRPAGRPGMAPS